MSYDIFAFDPSTAPSADGAVLDWFRQQANWSEQHSYDDPSLTTPKLQAFYRDLIKIFPPMNGPDAPADDENADTDYAISQDILYVSFRWAKADAARDTFIRLARTHGVGVCEVSESLAKSIGPLASRRRRVPLPPPQRQRRLNTRRLTASPPQQQKLQHRPTTRAKKAKASSTCNRLRH